MSESWVRLWSGMTIDPKFRAISRKSGRPLIEIIGIFAHLMICANENDDRGSITNTDAELVSAALDMDESDVQAILDAMQGRVIDGSRLSGWERRQPKREEGNNFGDDPI